MNQFTGRLALAFMLISAPYAQAAYTGPGPGNLVFEQTSNSGNIIFQTGATPTVKVTILNDGKVGINMTPTTEKLEVNGNIQADAFLYTSDKRLKKNFTPLVSSTENLMSLTTVKFDWISLERSQQTGRQIGLIAQEVQKVYPEAVREDSAGWLKVNYLALIAPIIDSIREMFTDISQLKKANKDLEERLKKLESTCVQK